MIINENKVNRTVFYTMAVSLILAAVLWFLLFVVKPMNFWLEMSLSILTLVAISLPYSIQDIKIKNITGKHILTGIVTAAILYLVFYIGNILSGYLFPFKDADISSVYSNRAGGNLFTIGLLLLFVIGPGEEIFWRGFIQKQLSDKLGADKGYLISVVLYAGVHIITGNIMLVIAAFVCGLFWGFMYKKEKKLLPVIISHALWDLTVFVIFPFR